MMPYQFDCSTCPYRCDGRSLGVYKFKNDVEYSEHFENQIIQELIDVGLFAKKTERDGYPDIEVYEFENGPIRCFIEVKAQRRSFMSVSRILPNSGLVPSETMALNLSDLLRYFDVASTELVPVYILWVLSERPCIVPAGQYRYFYQRSDVLQKIYNHYRDARRFRRASGVGDVVNGQHRGVVVNYHFSLQELMSFHINNI